VAVGYVQPFHPVTGWIINKIHLAESVTATKAAVEVAVEVLESQV
jgi:hypothetical protein